MTKLPNFSAVIFDLDGLVLDTESTYFAAWEEAANSMGYAYSLEFYRSLSGLEYAAIEQKLLHFYGGNFDLQAFKLLSGQSWRRVVKQQGIAIKPGFKTLLSIIKRLHLPFALATNSPQINAQECLALAGLTEVFTTLISREQVPNAKPAPDIFLHAAQQLNIPIQHCLVLEDSYNGVLSAYRAGASVIYVPSDHPAPEAEALSRCRLSDLSQVAALIEAQFS
ncbi:MAG: HAD family phosphatase [Methylococcaceae bacterium]|nr:HAD family phosphatase [Methylococcaceae bacterium]